MIAKLPLLDIVIVNWNAGAYLSHCLECISNANAKHYSLGQVLVVDNASTDGSIDIAHFSKPGFKAVRCTTNLGFAAACNLGASLSSAEFVLFLNPDVYLTADSLDVAMSYIVGSGSARIGACGIQLLNLDGSIQRSCARIPRPIHFFWHASGLTKISARWFPDVTLDEWDHKLTQQVPHIIGAFYLIRRNIFEAVGGFDERFFVYLEDLDLSARLGRLGWQIHYITEASAHHIGGGTSERARAIALFYSLRSRLIYARKHFRASSAFLVFISTLFIEPPGRIIQALLRRRPRAIVETFKAYRYLSRSILSCWSSEVVPNGRTPR
jgi:N-acetylglucosaminyl-diphospho-decaprenol L-rhamnosyltransferase